MGGVLKYFVVLKKMSGTSGSGGGSSGGGGGGDYESCSKASCWSGKNASERHMNLLSPKFSEKTFQSRISWALGRGCNCVHFFVTNQGDGENSGYSIWGGAPSFGHLSNSNVSLFKKRCEYCKTKNLGIVLWLMADDSRAWNSTMLGNTEAFASDMKSSGLLSYASTVVLGLELNEYANSQQVKNLSNSFRKVYSGKLGVHHTNDKATFVDYADILFYQVSPTDSSSVVKTAVKKALTYGKPVNMFELSRGPNRKMCEVALNAGAFGVGNW